MNKKGGFFEHITTYFGSYLAKIQTKNKTAKSSTTNNKKKSDLFSRPLFVFFREKK
jgi:hypothetical protein